MIIYTVYINNINIKSFGHKKDAFNFITQYDNQIDKIIIWKEEFQDDYSYEMHGYKEIIYSIN